jgi:hypothetical protein
LVDQDECNLEAGVADLKAMRDDDLAWAKPYVDDARASIARGEISSGEDFFKRLDAKLEALRSR